MTIVGVMLAAPAAAHAAQATLWASPVGSGTACTQAAPCSITQAQASVRAQNTSMTDDIVVNLLDGTYSLSSTLSFAAADSGTNNHFVIWQAAAGARPIISGGTQITGWTQSATPGIWEAPVASGTNFRQLYVNGQRMPRAGGTPPVTLTQTGSGYTASAATMSTWRNRSNIEFEYSGIGENHRHWTDSRCPISTIVGTAITMAQPCWGNLTTNPPGSVSDGLGGLPYFGVSGGIPTWVDNAYELLDQPGEWYLDRSLNHLYYTPLAGQNMTATTVVAPTLETLVSLTGTLDVPVHHIKFLGLTFAYATWLRPGTATGFAEVQANFTQTDSAADGRQGACTNASPAGSCPFGSWTKTPANVSLHAAQNVTFQDNTFVHLGGVGLGLEYGSSSNTITRNTFTDISGSGIQLGGTDDPNPSDTRATVSSVTVSSNFLHDLPVEYLGGVAIFAGYTKNVAIQNNHIENVAYSGISIGWGGWGRFASDHVNASRSNTITANLVANTMEREYDGGPIYSNGFRGTSYTDGDTYDSNVLRDSHNNGHAAYDDIGSRWITLDHQVVWAVPSAWGGCSAYGDMRFNNGFWTPPGSNFVCVPPVNPVTTSNNTALSAAAPGVDCENSATCAAILAGAGPQGSNAAVVDRRGQSVLLDDQSSAFTYSGSGWANDPNRPYRDLDHSLHYTTNNGDSVSLSFGGTGIDYIAELDANRGAVNILIDGQSVGTANCYAQQLVANQVCYRVRGLSPGAHTFQAVKLGSTYMALDAVRIYSDGGEGTTLNDTNPAVSYSGGSWAYGSNRGVGEVSDDLHYATANGDSYTVAFTGTGLELVGDRASNRGAIDVSVDAGTAQRIDASLPALATQQRLFSVVGLSQGSHTVTVTKRGGTYMDLDAVIVHSTSTVNDDSASIVYSGAGWVDSNARGLGDLNDDVHYTTTDGDSATLTLTGSGFDLLMETSFDRGAVDITVDGVPRGQVFTRTSGFAAQQTVYRVRGLGRGSHTVKLVKRGQAYMAIDGFRVLG